MPLSLCLPALHSVRFTPFRWLGPKRAERPFLPPTWRRALQAPRAAPAATGGQCRRHLHS